MNTIKLEEEKENNTTDSNRNINETNKNITKHKKFDTQLSIYDVKLYLIFFLYQLRRVDDGFEHGFKIITKKFLRFFNKNPKLFEITLFLFFFIISVIFYYNSILGCPYKQIMCLSYIGKKFLLERAYLCLYCSYIIGWIFNLFMLLYF